MKDALLQTNRGTQSSPQKIGDKRVMMHRLRTAFLAVVLLPLSPAFADGDAEQQTTRSATAVTAPAASQGDLDEIVVNGIRRGELILPTQVSSNSAFGMNI